jgi:hypothetical protein
MKEDAKVMQAYADDVLLFARSREGLEKVYEIVREFLEFTTIELNPGKCTAFKYVGETGKYVEPYRLFNRRNNDSASLSWIEGCCTFKYLGISLGKNKIGAMRFADALFEKVDLLLDRLKCSGLKISQIIHAAKMFVAPKFDYLFHNTVVPVTKVRLVDEKIRRFANSRVGEQLLSKALFYSDWRSDGFGLKSLVDRMSECRINQIVQLYNSQLRNYVEWRITEDSLQRGYHLSDESGYSDFMGWKDEFDRTQMKGTRIRYSPWNDAYVAASRLDIRINHILDEGEGKFVLEDKYGIELKVEFFDKKTFLATVNMWMKNRYRAELLDQRSRGACYGMQKYSVVSNFFLGNCKAPVSNALFRLVVRGRNDTLWTPVKGHFIILKKERRYIVDAAKTILKWKVYFIF